MSVVEEMNPFAPPSGDGPGRAPATQPPRRVRTGQRSARPSARPRPPRSPRQPMPSNTRTVFTALLLLAVVAGWFLVQVFVLGGLSQARAQSILLADLREQLAAQTAPTGGAITVGAPVAILAIPTLGLRQVVVEGTAAGDLLAGPGHRRDTALPGQSGIAIVYGRAATYGAPFRAIAGLREGDGLTVTTSQGEWTYRVAGVRHEGDPLPAPLAAGGSRLTLVTAEGEGLLSSVAPDRTVYVDATLVGEAATGPGGRPGSVPEAEKAFAVDRGVLPVLALSLQGLLLAVVGAVLALRRLPGRVVWVIATPILVAFAWLSTDAAVQLMPNLL